MPDHPPSIDALRRFRCAYGRHRAEEGRGAGGEQELLALPYLRIGPTARQWSVRSRTFGAFMRSVVARQAHRVRPRLLHVLDLGSGNGWLSYRLTLSGHQAIAIDIRDDGVDGLRAADGYQRHLAQMFGRAVASFEHLPLSANCTDVVVFNASLHYALDLGTAMSEATRVVRAGGCIAVLDSPFYQTDTAGQAMIEEKKQHATDLFGEHARDLTALPLVEYLTARRLAEATEAMGLVWRRHRVRYPLWYEARPLTAWLRRSREPSRFDLWETVVP